MERVKEGIYNSITGSITLMFIISFIVSAIQGIVSTYESLIGHNNLKVNFPDYVLGVEIKFVVIIFLITLT